MAKSQLFERSRNPLARLGRRHAAQFQSKCHILGNGFMWPQRIGLEYQPDVTLFRWHGNTGRTVEHRAARDRNPPLLGQFKTCHAAQKRCLAAARCTKERNDPPLLRRERCSLENMHGPECLVDAFNDKISHASELRA